MDCFFYKNNHPYGQRLRSGEYLMERFPERIIGTDSFRLRIIHSFVKEVHLWAAASNGTAGWCRILSRSGRECSCYEQESGDVTHRLRMRISACRAQQHISSRVEPRVHRLCSVCCRVFYFI